MVEVRRAGPEARARLAKQGRGYSEREPYRRAILGLAGDATIELIPDEDESLQKLKLLTTRAAREVGTAVKYGETYDGSLLLWRAEADTPRQRRTRRCRTSEPADEAAQA